MTNGQSVQFDFSNDAYNTQYLFVSTAANLMQIIVYSSSIGVTEFSKYQTDTIEMNGKTLTFTASGNRHYSLIKLN